MTAGCWFLLGSWLVLAAHGAELAGSSIEISQLVGAAAGYESGQSMQPLRRIEELIRQSSGQPALRKQLEAGLVQLLTMDSTAEAKQFACQELATIGTDDSLPALAQLLESEKTVSLACQALSSNHSAKANDVLRQALSGSRGAARVQLISTLGDHQDTGAIKQLAELANDLEVTVAQAAVLALGKVNDEPARQIIAQLREQAKPELAGAVVEASLNAAEKLAANGEGPAAVAIYQELLNPAEPANVRRGAFEALLQLDEDHGQRRILETLRGTDPLLKPVAIAGVRRLDSEAASREFARALPSLPAQEQIWLIEILANSFDRAVQSALANSLGSAEPSVRLAAIQAVGKSGDATTVPILAKMLAGRPSAPERRAVERALRGLRGGADLDSALVRELSGGSTSLKASLIPVLAQRDCQAAIPAILANTEDSELAETAFRALGALAGSEDVPTLLKKLGQLQVPAARSEAESAVTQALLKFDDHSRRTDEVTDELTRAPDLEARCSLLRLLPSCADATALALLSQARTDPHGPIRDTAIRALAEWPDASAWAPLVETLRHPENEAHRVLALNALVRFCQEENEHPGPLLIERYAHLLGDAHTDQDRQLILGALAEAAHPDALKLAMPLLGQPGVRAEAEVAIRKIANAIQKDHPRAAAKALRQLQ
jgi:HEAT repeat protein